MKELWGRVVNFIRNVQIVNASADDNTFKVYKVQYNGKEADIVSAEPFGFTSNMTPDTVCVSVAVDGDLSNRVLLGAYNTDRPVMAAGEVAVYQPLSSSIIHFTNAGSIDITGESDINLSASGTLNMTSGGDIDISTPGSVNLSLETIAIENSTAELIDLLSQINEGISAITVTTIAGASPINNLSTFIALQPQIDSFKE